MFRFPKAFSTALCLSLLIAVGADSTFAHYGAPRAAREPRQDEKQDKKEKRKERRARKQQEKPNAEPDKSEAPKANNAQTESEEVEIIADKQSKNGDLFIYDGYVNATMGDVRLQADHVTFNNVTGDMVAEGNVIFDQGADQRVTARRAEINSVTRKGIFWDTTGFTNRTQTGEYIFFTATRVEKTGPLTYELFNAEVTACEDVVPKWKFQAKRAELKLGDRITLHNSVFRVKSLPAFVLPFAWIPATRSERKSGFLLPTTGTSNQKGRTLKLAYYQTLGESADITFRSDVYTQRGLGFGAEFRAQTDEKSFMRMGVYAVKDRLFGPAGESQGGTAFVAEGQQYFPHGWVAVGNVSLVTNLAFRQIFSDDISQVVNPRRESTFYANNNTRSFSFNFLASNETTTLFRPSRDPLSTPDAGSSFDVHVRQAPEIDMTVYPRRLFESLPIYFSFDTSIGALKREETVDSSTVLVTPAAVQRFDFQPKITIPFATFAGIAITPSLSVRETFYTSSLDPTVPVFDPDKFATSAADLRLDPTNALFNPNVKLFDSQAFDPIIPQDISRHYAELDLEIRPPSLEKTFVNDDGTARFKHLIEPSITYRLIKGIGEEFNKIIRFDERDAIANTNEFEYSITNRFYTNRSTSDLGRKRVKKKDRVVDDHEMETVGPDSDKKKRKKKGKGEQDNPTSEKPAEQKPPSPDEAKPETSGEHTSESSEAAAKKQKLETGEQAELTKQGNGKQDKDDAQIGKDESAQANNHSANDSSADNSTTASVADPDAVATNEDAPAQSYEFMTVKVAQKYFIDRDFGGALVEGRRNQFFPINTLSGFTFGGRTRSFSPVNVAVRYRPLSSVYADLRMDVGSEDGAVRNVVVGGGVRKDKVTVSASYYLSRRIETAPNSFEPGTFPGNQIGTTIQVGDSAEGLYGGTRLSYDFTDQFISTNQVIKGRLRNSRSYFGYAWDCCGFQFNYNTFKAGLRNESAFSFTFTLAGLGSFGTDQFSQLGGGRGGRKRGKKRRSVAADDDFP
ncbi:MAG TPA: putative LPS assembly protein LptD [Blastocatellia bacterium]|nr:putative LPS assembly protein LptD [Blastocatellia bacterium]